MALIHQATMHPSKNELLEGWAPAQPWFAGDAGEAGIRFTSVASYRFDDPDGEVGIETLLVRAGAGPVLQVPVTYRDAPLEAADAFLIGTTEHSVLGTRWVYDGIGDPVYLAAAATVVLGGGRQADQYVDVDGTLVFRESSAEVTGSGTPTTVIPDLSTLVVPPATAIHHGPTETVVDAAPLAFTLIRHPTGNRSDTSPGRREFLTGTYGDQAQPQVLLVVVIAQLHSAK